MPTTFDTIKSHIFILSMTGDQTSDPEEEEEETTSLRKRRVKKRLNYKKTQKSNSRRKRRLKVEVDTEEDDDDPSNSEIPVCKACGGTFTSKSKLCSHYKENMSCRPKTFRLYQCEICSKGFCLKKKKFGFFYL